MARDASSTTSLRDLVCSVLPLPSNEDIIRTIIKPHHESVYSAFKQKLDSLTTPAPQTRENPCMWVPAAVVKRDGNRHFGGVTLLSRLMERIVHAEAGSDRSSCQLLPTLVETILNFLSIPVPVTTPDHETENSLHPPAADFTEEMFFVTPGPFVPAHSTSPGSADDDNDNNNDCKPSPNEDSGHSHADDSDSKKEANSRTRDANGHDFNSSKQGDNEFKATRTEAGANNFEPEARDVAPDFKDHDKEADHAESSTFKSHPKADNTKPFYSDHDKTCPSTHPEANTNDLDEHTTSSGRKSHSLQTNNTDRCNSPFDDSSDVSQRYNF